MRADRKILIVEDEKVIGHFIRTTLAYNGYCPLNAVNGREAIAMCLSHKPDLVLLDLGLPDMDGMDVLRELREWSDIPVIVVSARQAENVKVAALDSGANDYVTKPFGNAELLARIRMALRQHDKLDGHHQESRFTNGTLSIDYSSRLVAVSGQAVHLTPLEYKIVVLLARNVNKVLTHEHIISQVWGSGGGDNQTLRVNMANIRKKLEPEPSEPVYLLTETGVGYRMAAQG